MTLWADRDEPVLRHLAANPVVDAVLITESRSDEPRVDMPSITERDFHRAVEVLEDAGFVTWGHAEGEGSGGSTFTHFQVTGAGKQILGLWPHFDALGSPVALAALLEALAEDAATEEERSNLRKAAAAVRDSAPDAMRALVTGALGGFARSQFGL